MTLRRLGRSMPPLAAGVAALLLAACSGGGGGAAPPPPPDTTRPSIPAGLTATPTSATSAEVSWSAATDDVGVTGYEVQRDGAAVLTTASTAAHETGLAPLTRYCWTVRARDAAANWSASSPETCATTLAPPDLAPPAVVERTPAPGATGVAPAAVFTARFDEAIDPATLDAGFTLRDGKGAAVATTASWDAPTLTATLSPSAPLEHLGSYTAVIGTAVTDVAGNHLALEVGWTVRIAPKELVLQHGAGGGVPCVPHRAAFGDFDRDGHVDVAFVCGGSPVWVALGDGAGGFGAANGFAIPVRPGPTFLNGITAADLDGDGYPDLAVADLTCPASGTCFVNGSVDVLLNGGAAAPGTFGAPVLLTAGMYPEDVIAADLDADGNVDLASADLWSRGVSVFLGTGGGAFAAAVPYGVVEPVTLIATALRPGGPIDLVPPSGPVLLGNGLGAFTPGTGAFEPGPYAADVAAADLDADGDMDLVVANSGSDHVTVLRGDGTGAFPDATTSQTGQYPGFVETGDLNGDGWPDVLVVLQQNGGIGTNASVVLLGTGGGELGAPVMLYEQPFAVADLDGDGRPDLVGAHLREPSATYVLDTWLNVTP